MKIARLFAAAAVSASLVGVAPQAIAAQAPASPVSPAVSGAVLPAATSADSAAAQQILTRVNELRQSSGLQPLTRLVVLDDVAQDWSGQMAGENNMYHRPNLRAAFPSGWTWVAENVAMNGNGLSGTDLGNALFEQWVSSPGHYQNMVNRDVNSIGIGFAQSSTGIWYATMNLGIYDSNSTQMTPITTSSSTQPSRSTSNQAKPSTKSALATTTGPSIAVVAIITGLLGTGAFLVMRRRQAS